MYTYAHLLQKQSQLHELLLREKGGGEERKEIFTKLYYDILNYKLCLHHINIY